jgi:hypothetical protein
MACHAVDLLGAVKPARPVGGDALTDDESTTTADGLRRRPALRTSPRLGGLKKTTPEKDGPRHSTELFDTL